MIHSTYMRIVWCIQKTRCLVFRSVTFSSEVVEYFILLYCWCLKLAVAQYCGESKCDEVQISILTALQRQPSKRSSAMFRGSRTTLGSPVLWRFATISRSGSNNLNPMRARVHREREPVFRRLVSYLEELRSHSRKSSEMCYHKS